MTKRIYIVLYEIHANCQIQEWVYYCEATNAHDACEIAKATWGHKNHMFHLHAIKSMIQDINAISVKTWKGNVYKGQSVMGWHIMRNSRTWRVNGRNLYA